MHIWTSWGVLGCPRVSWGIKTDRWDLSMRFVARAGTINQNIG